MGCWGVSDPKPSPCLTWLCCPFAEKTGKVLGEFCRCYKEQFGVALFNSVRYEIEGAGGPQAQLLHRKVRAPSPRSTSFPEPRHVPSPCPTHPAGWNVALCSWSSPSLGRGARWGSLGWFLFPPRGRSTRSQQGKAGFGCRRSSGTPQCPEKP